MLGVDKVRFELTFVKILMSYTFLGHKRMSSEKVLTEKLVKFGL